MGTHAIQAVKAVRGIVDRLRWEVRVSTTFHGAGPFFIAHWEGEIGFYRDASLGNGRMMEVPFGLKAEWMNREKTARVGHPDEAILIFETALPGDALDRIERYRGGGRLHARLEGRLFLVYRDVSRGPEQPKPWIDGLVSVLGNPMMSHDHDVCSTFHELTHHKWCEEILLALRPPGRYVFDVQLPNAVAGEDPAAKRAIERLKQARELYDAGGLPSAIAGAVYVVLDETKCLFGPFEQRHGSFGAARLEEQRKALAAMCNPDRHARREEHDELEFDRRLALHALVSASSILSSLLR